MNNIIASTAPKARQLTHEEIHEIEHEKLHYPYAQAVGLEALKIVQKYQGWVSDESLLAVAEYLKIPADDLEGVATFFNLIYRRPVGKNVILFCDSVACWMLGCDSLKEQITQKLGIDYGQTTADNLFTLIPVPCLGDCDRAPTMMVGNEHYRDLTPAKIDEILASYKAKGVAMEKNPLTKNIEPGRAPFNLQQYIAAGGYESVAKALTMKPRDLINHVKDSGLGGRGGAGFNTGLKWSFIPEPDGGPRYLVVNADEMEPGTFKDRLLMEHDPHLLIEGVVTSAIALEATQAYIFLRGEYKVAEKALHKAIAEAYEGGLLGKNIKGSNYSLELALHTSAGRYICGEETALINALEGKRANPRAKPPFPQVSGLWGRPTLVNNVETICNIPGIVKWGNDWFKGLGINGQPGTRISGVSGRVKKPGCWEMPAGTTFRTLLEDYAGGMKDGYKLKAFLPGGGSTDFLMPEHLDLPMIPGDVAKAGSRLGTSLIMVLDDKTCPIGCMHNLTKFFAHESCGWCTPCRDGLPWAEHIFKKLEEGEGEMKDIEILKEMTVYMGPGNTFCALAPGAAEPIQSGLKYFMDEFVAHVNHGCSYKH